MSICKRLLSSIASKLCGAGLLTALGAAPASALAATQWSDASAHVTFGVLSARSASGSSDGAALGFVMRAHPVPERPYLRAGADAWAWGGERPVRLRGCFLLCGVDDKARVSVTSFSGSLGVVYPPQNPLQVHAEAGLGLAFVKYRVQGHVVGIPTTAAESRDTTPIGNLGLGISYQGKGRRVGLDLRRFDVRTGSGKLGIEKFDAGGDYVGLSVSLKF